MAFLDNSGDIILDAVLTDTGRYRLAKGDGSFRIAKFALADDEIDYELYNKSHSSGSAYYDLEVLQTPILEAFTNNSSTMKNLLMSINRTNLLFLPVLKLNSLNSGQGLNAEVESHVVAVDKDTFDDMSGNRLNGAAPGESGGAIRVDQGLDTTEISFSNPIDSDLVETQYIVQIDNRFGNITNIGGTPASISFIDDDQVAMYYLSLGTDSSFVATNTQTDEAASTETIAGPRGTTLTFKIQSSIELNSSSYLFQQMGSTTTTKPSVSGGGDVLYIDSIVRVTGATTGVSIDIPVRFAKKA